MAYDEGVVQRLRDAFADRRDIVEKKMFGGVAFMHRGNMCVGVSGDRLMARVGPASYETALKRQDVTEMDFTGRPLTGFVFVGAQGIAEEHQLMEWIDLCLHFTESLPAKPGRSVAEKTR